MDFLKRLRNINIDYLMYGILFVFFLFMLFFSSFRDMVRDESIYFKETWLISEVFKQGQWLGNYSVGLHGILLKIPPALTFLITGPSVTVVTVYNIFIASAVGLIFYNISKKILKEKSLALLSTLLLLSTFHFFSSVPTYLREIPSLLAVLIFIYGLIKNWGKWGMGIAFLLLLDTKEYVFFVFIIFYLVWLYIESDKKSFGRIIQVLKDFFIVLLPSIIWILLMFCTGIIPINMYLASTIGLIDLNFEYLFSQFSIDLATLNLIEGGRNMPLIPIQDSWSSIVKEIVGIFNTALLYFGKIMYPRTFSFVSVPKVVMFPVIFTSFLLIKEYIKTNKQKTRMYAGFSLLILIWLVIYILRASHGRYLLPVVPVISITYIYLFFQYKYTPKQLKTMLIGTILFVVIGFFFETSYVISKVIIELLLYSIFVVAILKPRKTFLKYLLILLISTVCIGVSILFTYTQGQLYGYKNWGRNRNVEEIAKVIPQNERYWSNNDENQPLLSVFSNETYSLVEWKWKLNKIVPRIEGLKTLGEQRSFVFPVKNIEEFKNNLRTYEITKMVLFESTIEGRKFTDEEYLNVFLDEDWIELDNKYVFKGINIYILNIKWNE